MSERGREIRASALALRANYAQEIGLPAAHKLPLEDVVERMFLLSAFDDPLLDPHIYGELNPLKGTIRLQAGLPEHRRRFVIAHEIGHLVLERSIFRPREDSGATIDETGLAFDGAHAPLSAYHTRERHEQEANRFARELLVPADLLREAVQQDGWTVASIAELFAAPRAAVISQLVSVCCVEPPVARPAATGIRPVSDTLDAMQLRAVNAPAPAFVIAGPGTGKTRCLADRYLRLIENGVSPARILALTFSNRAADEMRSRIRHALDQVNPEEASTVEISTFHAWGLQLLRQYGHSIELPSSTQLRDPTSLYGFLQNRLSELPLGVFADERTPDRHLPALLRAISRAKDELWNAVAYQEQVTGQGEPYRSIAAFYEYYEELLRAEGIIDYGDLGLRTVQVLEDPAIAAELHQRYTHILVDELQDINHASTRMLELLDGGRGYLWGVGDSWQSIYHFRGASSDTLDILYRQYHLPTTVTLDQNYRSVQPILDACYAVMNTTSSVRCSPLRAMRQSDTVRAPVLELIAPDEDSACAAIAHDILRNVGGRAQRRMICAHPTLTTLQRRAPHGQPRRERSQFGDHAVLYRLRSDGRRIAATLAAHGIPFDIDYVDTTGLYPDVDAALVSAASTHTSTADAYEALTEHLFRPVSPLRRCLQQSRSGDDHARRELQRLGHLLLEAKTFVDAAPATARDLYAFRLHLDRLSRMGETRRVLSLPRESNVVRVMSMHAAKGLEFPIVYVTGLEEREAASRAPAVPVLPAITQEAQAQADRNLLYVAMSRAQDRLTLVRAATFRGRIARRLHALPVREPGTSSPWPSVDLPFHSRVVCRCRKPAAHSVSHEADTLYETDRPVAHGRPGDMKQRQFIYAPAINPGTFLFFFHRGRSYSFRDYVTGASVITTYHDEYPYSVDQVYDLAELHFEAPTHPTEDLAFWRKQIMDLNRRYLADRLQSASGERVQTQPATVSVRASRPPLQQSTGHTEQESPSFPLLAVDRLLSHPVKGAKPQDLDRIFHAPRSEDYVTWNVLQLLIQDRQAEWWPTLLDLARADAPRTLLAYHEDEEPTLDAWRLYGTPPAYETASRQRMADSDNPAWIVRSRDPRPVEGRSEIDLVIEGRRCLVFVEAKLHSDISQRTTYDPERNQIVRNVDCLLEGSGSRMPAFWVLAKDRDASRDYTRLMRAYRERPALLAAALPHRSVAAIERVSRNLAIIRWEDLLASLSHVPADLRRELERRFGSR